METLLRKYLWAVDLLAIALCAVFSARATAGLIESRMVQSAAAMPKRHAVRAASPGPVVYSKGADEILKRNIFCSGCPPILPPPEDPNKPKEPAGPEPPTRTALPLKLMAVMYSPPPHDPRWSMAVIRDTETKGAGPFSIGMKVRDAEIEDIQETRVYLKISDTKHEFLDLFDAPPPAPDKPKEAAGPSTDPLVAALDAGLKKTGEHSFEVQKTALDALTGNMAALSRAARIVPEVRDGRPVGFRLFSIRPDGPFAKIGLQNGDVISAINGLEMNSPDQALAVYTKLRTASHLTVAVERNGQKITKDYNIR